MDNRKTRIPTDGGSNLSAANPFAGLNLGSLPPAPTPAPPGVTAPVNGPKPGRRGRVEVRRLTAGKGGKTVTEVKGFTGTSPQEKETLLKTLKAACGAGGTLKDGAIEIQGDHRPAVLAALEKAGYKPVLAGG